MDWPMTDLNDVNFYRSRERHERALAERAGDPAIAAIHTQMADRYAELASALPGTVMRPVLRANFGKA